MKRKPNNFYKVTPSLLNKIERLAKKLNITQIADSIGWSRETFYQKMKENSDIADALQRGQSAGISEISGALYKSAKGYSYKETHVEEVKEGGKVVSTKTKTVKKRVQGSVQAQMDYLTNKDPENWKRRQETEHSGGLSLGVGDIKEKDVEKVEGLLKRLRK